MSLADREDGDDTALAPATPKGIQAFRVTGALFFGAAERFRDTLSRVATRPKVLILRLGAVPAIDSTGLRVLAQIAERCTREGTQLMLCELNEQPAREIARAGLAERLGPDGVFDTYDAALASAKQRVGN
jgi:SulP family sulfate permease